MTDGDLKAWVLQQLDWERDVDGSHIGVTCEDGAVTLSGHVPSYADRWAAVKAARRVRGVKAVADEIAVELKSKHRLDDSDVAKRIAHVLDWNVAIPEGDVQARVTNGHVVLTGKVDWDEQRRHIARQVAHVGGVKDVRNSIEIVRKPTAHDIEKSIHDALIRSAAVEADGIKVDVEGSTVRLSGRVAALQEKDMAHRAAWAAPGVQAVIDEIAVR